MKHPMDLYKNPFTAQLMSELKTNLGSMADRAADAAKWYDLDNYEMVKAELFYLRCYLDAAEERLLRLKNTGVS